MESLGWSSEASTEELNPAGTEEMRREDRPVTDADPGSNAGKQPAEATNSHGEQRGPEADDSRSAEPVNEVPTSHNGFERRQRSDGVPRS